MTIMIPIDAVRVGAARRRTTAAKVRTLADSIASIGLRTPITVLPADVEGRYGLVAGRNRLEACRLLGHAEIAAEIETDALVAQMWEIAENVHRSDINELQRAMLIGRWVKLQKRKEKRDRGGAAPPLVGGLQPHDRGVKATARTLGMSPRSARRAINITEHLTKPALREAERLGLLNNQRALSSAAGCLDTDAQILDLQRTAQRKAKRKAERAQMKAVLAGTDKPRSPKEAFDRWFNSFDVVMKVEIRIWLLSKAAEEYFEEQEQIEQRRKAMH